MCFIRERIVSSINGVGKTGQPHANKKKRERERLDYYLIPFTKNQLKMSKWIKDLNVRPEIIKLLDKTIRYSLSRGLEHYLSGYVTAGNGNKSKNK